MHVYLDESGDTGFEFHRGSSKYFVVALLLVDDPDPVRTAVDRLRARLHLDETHEFKFSRSSDEYRAAFLTAIRPHPLRVRCLVVPKQDLWSKNLRTKEKLYNYIVKLVLEHDGGAIRDAILVIDESFKGSKRKSGLATYLRRELNRGAAPGARKIREVRYHQSHRDNLIQVVDMIVGTVARWYERPDDPQFMGLIRSKIDDIWMFG